MYWVRIEVNFHYSTEEKTQVNLNKTKIWTKNIGEQQEKTKRIFAISALLTTTSDVVYTAKYGNRVTEVTDIVAVRQVLKSCSNMINNSIPIYFALILIWKSF